MKIGGIQQNTHTEKKKLGEIQKSERKLNKKKINYKINNSHHA